MVALILVEHVHGALLLHMDPLLEAVVPMPSFEHQQLGAQEAVVLIPGDYFQLGVREVVALMLGDDCPQSGAQEIAAPMLGGDYEQLGAPVAAVLLPEDDCPQKMVQKVVVPVLGNGCPQPEPSEVTTPVPNDGH